MAINTTRAKQIKKKFRKNYGPKPKITTSEIKGRRGAVKAGQKTYAKKDGTISRLTREQTLRTMRKLNQAAKKKSTTPKRPVLGRTISRPTNALPLGPDNSTRVSRSDLKKKRPGSGRIKTMMRGGIAKKKK